MAQSTRENRICSRRKCSRARGETYHAEPEFLWRSLPECAALRVPGKKPWFAVAGRIPKEKIGIEEGGLTDDEIINLIKTSFEIVNG